MRHLRLASLAALIAGLVIGLAAPAAFAKEVFIKWSPLKGATGYELQIEREGKTISRKKLTDPTWTGQLPFGVYAYQIRGIDRIQRPGRWTEPLPLAVMPDPPELQSLEDGRKVTQYSSTAGSAFKWKPVDGVSAYRVEILRKGGTPLIKTTSAHELVLKSLPPGEYSWKVVPLVKPKGRVPASFNAKEWEGKPSGIGEFKLERAQLDAPKPFYPQGVALPPDDGKVAFKWSKVTGADAYELEVFAKPAAPSKAFARQVVADNTASVPVPKDGKYGWRVRALANLDEKQVPAAAGPQSTADFQIDKNASFLEGSGYVALSTMFAPYTYHVVSPEIGQSGDASSSAITGRLSGEYWYRPQWGAAAAFELTQFQIGSQSLTRKGFELVTKYRVNFGDGKYNWSLSPKVGFEGRDYFELFPAKTGLPTFFTGAYGAQIGADLRKAITDRFSVGIKLAYFYPLLISSSNAKSLTADASRRNVSLGAQVLYWAGKRWGVGIGAYIEKRSISYTLSNPPAGVTDPEQVFTDGTYFFGSLIYSFGK